MGYALGAWLCSSLAYVFVEYFYSAQAFTGGYCIDGYS